MSLNITCTTPTLGAACLPLGLELVISTTRTSRMQIQVLILATEPRSWSKAMFGRMYLSHLAHSTATSLGKKYRNLWRGDKANNDRYANAFDNDFGIGNNSAPEGTLTETSMPYKFTLLGSGAVKAAVVGTAGATLDFA